MTRAKMVDEMKVWFQKAKDFDFFNLTPGNSYVRRDSPYTFDKIYENDEKLYIETCNKHDKRKFIISGDFQYRFIDNNFTLEIENFDLGVHEWEYEIPPGTVSFDGATGTRRGSQIYEEGKLLFMSCRLF